MQFETKHKYDYPGGVNLQPDSDLHKKLLEAARDRIRRGYNTTRNMRDMWRKMDHLQTAYVPADTNSIWEKKKDPKSAVDVVIPLSRACLEMQTAYMGGTFMGDPTGLYALTARSDPEKFVKAAKMEALLNTQSMWFKHRLSHFIGFRDTNLYGLSVKAPKWTKHKRRQPVVAEVTDVLYQILKKEMPSLRIGDFTRYMEERIVHEGSALENIDVYSLILDPYATLNHIERAEFMGYWRRTHLMDLLRRESDPEERLFNCKYVREMVSARNGRTETLWAQESGRHDRFPIDDESPVPGHPGTETTSEVDVATLFWQLIPGEWGLSDKDSPELYEVTVAGDELIIGCHSLEYDHAQFPMVFSGPSTSGYDLLPISGLAATYGMQQFVDWAIRTHWFNASKVMNDMFIVDGSAIEIEDFKRPGPGKIIRLKRPLYGEAKIDQFFTQLQVQNVTGNYMSDVRNVTDMLNHILGTQNMVSGNLSDVPDRPTQVGMQAAQQNAFSRLQMYSEMVQEQEWSTLIHQMAHNNAQFMDEETVVSIIGSRFEEQLRAELDLPMNVNEVRVDPFNDLDMDSFDILPISRMQKELDMGVMQGLMERFLAIPEIAYEAFGGVDVSRMFMAMVRKMGFPNIYEYRRMTGNQMPAVNARVIPDEQVAAAQQAGNLVPAQEAVV